MKIAGLECDENNPYNNTCIIEVSHDIEVYVNYRAKKFAVWIGDYWGFMPREEFAKLIETVKKLEENGYEFVYISEDEEIEKL